MHSRNEGRFGTDITGCTGFCKENTGVGLQSFKREPAAEVLGGPVHAGMVRYIGSSVHMSTTSLCDNVRAVEGGWAHIHEKQSQRLYGAADPCRSHSFWDHAFASFGTIGQRDAITAQHSSLEARYKTATNALSWNGSRNECDFYRPSPITCSKARLLAALTATLPHSSRGRNKQLACKGLVSRTTRAGYVCPNRGIQDKVGAGS
jgi:hypothetical protein